MKLYTTGRMTFDAEAAIKAIEKAKLGDWLILYDPGADIDTSNPITTYLINFDNVEDFESYSGATLLFLDEDDFLTALACVECGWNNILGALYCDGKLPEFKYIDDVVDIEKLTEVANA